VLAYVKSTTQSDELPNGVPLYVNPRGLQQAEKTLQSPVTLNLPGLPLKTTLRLLLRQLDLEYSVQNGLLAIDYIGARDSQVDDAFQRVGHGLFAMVFAGVGGIAGLLFYAAREREANQAASSA
jgi:hypothetical protein